MKVHVLGIFFILIIAIVFFVMIATQINKVYHQKTTDIKDGKLLLSTQEITKNGIINLKGKWRFYPNIFLEQESPSNTEAFLVSLPGLWKKELNIEQIEAKGYGSYQLKIQYDESPIPVSFFVPMAPSEAYEIYFNHTLVYKVGKIGRDEFRTIPEYRPAEVDWLLSDDLLITIQVSDFSYQEGGFYKTILLGTESEMEAFRQINLIKDSFGLGLLTMLLMFLMLVKIINKNSSVATNYLLVISLISIFYIASTGEFLIIKWLPDLDFQIYYLMYYLMSIMGSVILVLLLNALYENESVRWYVHFSVVKTICICAVYLLLMKNTIGMISNIKDLLAILDFVYSLMVIAKAIVGRKKGAVIIGLGTVILLGTVIHDILYLYSVIFSLYELLVPFGLIIFILSFSVIILVNYEDSFNKIKSLSQELLKLDKVKDEFLTNTSHELRTPLNSMIALIESLKEHRINLSVSENEIIDMISKSSKRLRVLVNDLLDYSSMKYGKMKLVQSFFDMNELVQNVLNETEGMCQQKDITIFLQLSNKPCFVYADKYRIVQVLYNLIGNAIKFSTVQGNIKISTIVDDEWIQVAVEDNGIGISRDRIETIFNSFEQENELTGIYYGGIGIGLSISKEIILAHEGNLTVDSAKGKGSTFVFSLPFSKKSGTEFEQNEEIEIQSYLMIKDKMPQYGKTYFLNGSSEETIIIIDDDYPSILAAANILKLDGYTIKGYVDQEEGLQEVFRNQSVALVILDYMMPKLTGKDMAVHIRKEYSLLDIPIIILTARLHVQGLVACFEAGANDFLFKPFETEELRARASTLIQLKRTKAEAVRSEMKYLQMQMNPHFLYNALNSIAAWCYEDGEKAADLMIDFAEYLRYNLEFDVDAKEISLSKELELINIYLMIEKMRFEESIEFEIHVKDDYSAMIPPFVLQTLVENAIRHGIRKKANGGKIIINGKISKDVYVIEVVDNGVGMSKEDLKAVLSGEKYCGMGIGIANVQKRLRGLPGSDFRMESIFGQGTTVTVQLPIKKL